MKSIGVSPYWREVPPRFLRRGGDTQEIVRKLFQGGTFSELHADGFQSRPSFPTRQCSKGLSLKSSAFFRSKNIRKKKDVKFLK